MLKSQMASTGVWRKCKSLFELEIFIVKIASSVKWRLGIFSGTFFPVAIVYLFQLLGD